MYFLIFDYLSQVVYASVKFYAVKLSLKKYMLKLYNRILANILHLFVYKPVFVTK